jgi:hypothetical protein
MRRWLVVFLAAAAAVLSFDALRAQALASGAVHHQALAAVWALVVDGMAAAGVLGVRSDRRDWRAWIMLLLAFGCSVAFQVLVPPAWLARAVPPVALLLAIVVLELPRAHRNVPAPVPPAGPVTVPVPVPPERAAVSRPSPARQSRSRTGRAGRSQSDKIRAFVLAERAEGRDPSAAEAARRFGADPSLGRRIVRELAASNGHAAPGGSA